MFVTRFKRSAFERQIDEAVTIERESKESEILNSKSEWNQCQLPRLVTRIGNKEEELKILEKEMEEDKKLNDEVEKKIRNMVKIRNKARLITERGLPPQKRRKMEDQSFISIRNTWGHPTTSAPMKNLKETSTNDDVRNAKKPKLKQTEKLTNIRRVENRPIVGETITEFDILVTDWDEVLEKHKERLEEETRSRKELLDRKSKKEKHFELYRECKTFLETNDKNWEKRKQERELEKKRKTTSRRNQERKYKRKS